jgi:hypothetical protein
MTARPDRRNAGDITASTAKTPAHDATELSGIGARIIAAGDSDRRVALALKSVAGRAPAPVALTVRISERLAEPIAAAAYFLDFEALANDAKYARPRPPPP